jgi:hypothetical protein
MSAIEYQTLRMPLHYQHRLIIYNKKMPPKKYCTLTLQNIVSKNLYDCVEAHNQVCFVLAGFVECMHQSRLFG